MHPFFMILYEIYLVFLILSWSSVISVLCRGVQRGPRQKVQEMRKEGREGGRKERKEEMGKVGYISKEKVMNEKRDV